jgi:hypothetical protein
MSIARIIEIIDAQQLGADICFLESSQMGINLYKKIGFKSLNSNNYFTVPEKNDL